MAKVSSFGAKVEVGSSPVLVVNLKDISWSGMSTTSHDGTTHDSTGGWTEHIPGIKSAGEITFDVAWDADGVTHDDTTGGLYDLHENSTIDTWTVTFTDSTPTTLAASGFITSLDWSLPVDGIAEASVSVQLTGAPTYT